jgi:AraC family transcriptional regulator
LEAQKPKPMSQQPLAIDFLQESAPAQILPNLPILASHQSSWSSIHLAHHRQPPWELPEMFSQQNIIYLPDCYQAEAHTEFVANGRLQEVEFYPHDYKNGCFGILPAHLTYKICWDVHTEFTHLYLEPEFLNQVAPETVNPDRVELRLELKLFDPLIYHLSTALKASLENR